MESHKALAVKPVHGEGAGASMSAAAEVFKAVAHPVRAQILELLSHGGSSIPELCEGTGVKATHLSRHLTQMRGQHLIQCRWTSGRLIYWLAYPEVAELLAAVRSILQARTAAVAGSLGPLPEEMPFAALGDGLFSALEGSLESRSVIADACRVMAARSGCSPDAAAVQLLTTARTRRVTLLDAARDELSNGQERHPT